MLDPTLEAHEQFRQLSGNDALAQLVKVLSYPLPASMPRVIARETALEKLQARAFQAWGLDRPGNVGLHVKVEVMNRAPVRDSHCITECITDSQVIDVQGIMSDKLSEGTDGEGI
jgi:hypothetical protein